ncbi:IS3 family transposase [Carnobacterium divergens]|uniref:IS3 family transposase n=1 Tax=Carnobacterium divergens TaxID=2748 RepID=UPI0007F544CA|nr:IS3 family transposase [Carnobacterium divergens]SBO17124.1 transposase [Carnobacterium divergens]
MIAENIVQFIKQNTDTCSITNLTELFGISRSFYYRHQNKEKVKFSYLEQRIQQLTKENHFLYGYRKIHALISKEFSVGINKVARIMRKYGWNCIAKKKKFKKPGNPYKSFENVINKDWAVDRPLCKLTTDITYLPFGKSMLYLSTIMDTLNQIDKFPKGAILHSDQGSTYTSKEFFEVARKKNVIRSMSRKGTPSDNAPIESFHSSLKSETFYINKEPIGSNNIVIDIVENYITFWNNKRVLTKLGHLSPVDYRKKMT